MLFAAAVFAAAQTAPIFAEAATVSENSNLQTGGFQMDGSTLVRYTGTEKNVSVPASVKIIGEAAFEGNTTMEKVTIPEGVEKIAYSAFADCTGLRTVVMSDTVVSIGNSAFSNCSRLINVNFGKGLKELGTGAFAGCDSLEDITIKKGNAFFVTEKGALYDAEKKVLYQVFAGREGKTFEMPSTVTQIEPYAFWGCDALKNIYISSNVSEISEYAFSNCKSLQSIQIPYSVKSIGLKAFEDCVNLRKTIIGPTVTQIHETAFDGCFNLYIEAEEGTAADRYAKEHDLTKTDQVEYEETGSDEKEESDSAKEDEPVQPTAPINREGLLADSYIVGNRAVLFIDNSKAVVHDGSKEPEQTDIPENEPSTEKPPETDSRNEKPAENGGEAGNMSVTATKGFTIPKLKVVDGKRIAGQAYYKDEGLTSYEIPKGVEGIGQFAFARSGLTEIVIPKGVTQIGYAAFYHCDSLGSVSIPATVTQIEAKAFEKTPWLENWKNGSGSDFLIVGDGILLAYRGNSTVVALPEGVKQIAPEAFLNHTEITEVQLPNSLKLIGEKAFCDCTALERVTGGAYVTAICDRAFYNCPIQTVRIPDTVTRIGAGAFAAPEGSLQPEERCVVFHGKKLPELTCEASAFRLSDTAARSLAFDGIGTAVILEETESFENTVLDANVQGFRGIICEITDEGQHEISCVGSTLSAEELAGKSIPEDVIIYDVRYTLENAAKVKNFAVDKERTFTYEGRVLFSVDCDLFPDETKMSAHLEGNTSEYYVRIRNHAQAAEQIRKSYEAVYKQELTETVYGFDMELVEAASGLSIQKLGRQLLKITLPVPEGLEGKTFRLVCLDEDGQLESIDYTLSEEEDVLYLTFELNHFSTFGFYVTGEVPTGSDRTLATGNLDESPDTGDGLHPVLFLIAGAAFLTVAFLIGNRKKSSGIS